MADAEHVAKLLEGVAAWNKWREDNPGIIADLKEVDLTENAFRSTALYGRDEKGRLEINLQHVNLQRADLRRANLQGAILLFADLQDAKLLHANLQGAKLSFANLQDAILMDTNLRGVDFTCTNLQDANVGGVKFDHDSRQTTFLGVRASGCHGSQAFKSFAQDQDYIEELRGSGKWGKAKFWLWWLFADCGRSFSRWALWSLGLAVLFGIVYYSMGIAHIKPEPPLPFSLITMIYYSVVTFTTLGFGDVKPQTELAAIIVMIEVIIGYVMLGGLVSILANKLARRA
jgi:Ion channel/Pentapeptide repeats (8 copies)